MVGTGTIKCLTVLCEAGPGASPAAPSPWAVGKIAGQSGAPGGFPRGFCRPPRCSAKQFITCDVSPMLSPRARLGTCEPLAAPGRDPSAQYPNSGFLQRRQHPGFVPQPTSPSKTRLLGQASAKELLLCSGHTEESLDSCSALRPPGSRSCPTAEARYPMLPHTRGVQHGTSVLGRVSRCRHRYMSRCRGSGITQSFLQQCDSCQIY